MGKTKKKLRTIDELSESNLLIYYYHLLLYTLMKESDFTPNNETLEIFCQLNPGYNILTNTDADEKSVLTQLHTNHLEDFYKFSMINRTGEIIQNYTDKYFTLPEEVMKNIDQYTSSLYLLKTIKPENVEIDELPRVTKEGYDVLTRWCNTLKKNIVIVDNQMGEIFDNLCYDMYSTFNLITVTQMNSHKEDTLIEIEKEQYFIMINWLLDHIEDSYSISGRDSGRFYQVLMVFIWMHHVSTLIGGKEPGANQVTWRAEKFIKDSDPLFYLKNPSAKADDDYHKWLSGYDFFQSPTGRKLYNRLAFYGHINQCNCICSKNKILPTKGEKRTYDNTIISFLVLQQYLYEKIKSDDDTERCEG